MNKNKILSGGGKNLTGGGKWGWRGREVGGEGEGSGVKGGGKWGERGREVGVGYPPVHPLYSSLYHLLVVFSYNSFHSNKSKRPHDAMELNSDDKSTAFEHSLSQYHRLFSIIGYSRIMFPFAI